VSEQESPPVAEVVAIPKERRRLKVALVGTPGCGKTSVSLALQSTMGSTSFIVSTCSEYAREYLTKYGKIEHIAIQSSIGYKQKRREDILSESCDLLVSDSPLFFCWIYAALFADPTSPPQMKIVRDLYKWFVLDVAQRYDSVIYLPKQFDVVDDGVRDPEAHVAIEDVILGFLRSHKHLFRNYVEIRSELTEPQEILHDRTKLIKKYLKKTLEI